MHHRWRQQSDHGFDLHQARQVRSPPSVPQCNAIPTLPARRSVRRGCCGLRSSTEKHDVAHHTKAKDYRREPHRWGLTGAEVPRSDLGTEACNLKNENRDSVLKYIVPRCYGVLGRRGHKRYRTNPSAIAKIAARPAAIAAHALHWLCSYTKRRSNLGSSRPVSKPRFARGASAT